MTIRIQGASEHNLKGVDLDIDDGLTVVTGVSGSGKTSLVFDTWYHEARRRFLEVYELGSPKDRMAPARVEAITGLGPAVAVGQNLLNRNPNSTLATAAGLHPFLRLLYAHFGERACVNCGENVSVYTEDEIVEQLTALAKRGLDRVYAPLVHAVTGGHRTLLAALADRFGRHKIRVDGSTWDGTNLDPHIPHAIEIEIGQVNRNSLGRELVRQAAALGVTAITVRTPNNQNSEVQTLARAPVCPACGTWFTPLSPVDFNKTCVQCGGIGCTGCQGTGLPPQSAATRWNGLGIAGLLALPVESALTLFSSAKTIGNQPPERQRSTADPASFPPALITERLETEIGLRLAALQQVGLGYISLDRPSPTLSRGEAQRVRLALTLISRLEDMLHVLDEPTVGQHPKDIQRLLPAFRQLAGPVVFVEHERAAAKGADRAIDLGPGAGQHGGRVVFEGTPKELWGADTATGRYFSQQVQVQSPVHRPIPEQFLLVRGAQLRNLEHIDVPIPLGRLTVITGISGSGKSTLVEDVLVASLKQGSPVGCQGIEPAEIKPIIVDQSPIGRNPRSNPATYTKLSDTIRDLYAAETGLSPSHFSFNRPEGACPICKGLGAIEVTMRYLPSTWIPCADCEGRRYNENVAAASLKFGDFRYSISDFYALAIEEVQEIFRNETRLPTNRVNAAQRILKALCEIGLGYLSLGQPSPTLSGGEAQRVKLAKYLGRRSLEKQLLVLDEPSTGLHPQDLAGLLTVLDRLVRAGATIIIVEHNTDVIRAADWVIDLGPGAGPNGGQLLYSGPVAGLEIMDTPTGKALWDETRDPGGVGIVGTEDPQRKTEPVIKIRNAHVHNLQNVDVDIPKGRLTVVTGVSGSGKSSLVHDVLEAEARRRFLETLSLYERQGTREGPETEVDAVSGLGVALTVGAGRLVYSRRATVGTATEIHHHLAILLSVRGQRICLQCGTQMTLRAENWDCPACGANAPLAAPRHFSPATYAAACLKCNGVGTLQIPNPQKLIVAPNKPLVAGAMYSPGFFPNGYLGKPFNGGYYQVQALGAHYGFDPAMTPWNQIHTEAQQAFLFGSEVELTIHYESRTGRRNTYQGKWPGFYGMIRDWDVGGTYTNSEPCPSCQGTRLRPEYLAVKLGDQNIYELNQMTLWDLEKHLQLHLPSLENPPSSGARSRGVQASMNTVQERLQFLIQVGLGYLHLGRIAGTLSAGEAQRIRLASLLGSGLTALTLLLDEPTRGLHPGEVDALVAALVKLRDEGNTVIVVEHDLQVMRAADWLVDVGPGAGQHGGQIVAQGPAEGVAAADTLTGIALRTTPKLFDQDQTTRKPGVDDQVRPITIRGARANNLKDLTLDIPLGRMVGVCGVSGSGKSTLVIDTLGRALAPKKQTTSVAYEPVDPGEHDAIEGDLRRVLLVDQSKSGVSSPAGFLKLVKPLQTLYAASKDAKALGINQQQLASRCSSCRGTGTISLDMAFLPAIHQPCETCNGTGCVAEAWKVRLYGIAYPDVFNLTIDQAFELFGGKNRLSRSLAAARDVGLGYLVLRQPRYSLSGGEAQRLKIASELSRASPRASKTSGSLYILDEPTIGQHLSDVARLTAVLRRLVTEGGSVIVVEHHPHLLAACDWLLELGPVGGPEGGYLVAAGPPAQIAAGATPTAPYLREVL